MPNLWVVPPVDLLLYAVSFLSVGVSNFEHAIHIDSCQFDRDNCQSDIDNCQFECSTSGCMQT